MKRILLCLFAFLLGGSMMQAQLPTGTILGVVKDSSGAVVPGAKITVLSTGTGQTRAVVTGGDGAYRLDALPIGNYQITAEASGFRTEVQSGLTLSVGEELAANITLQVGEAAQTVSVTGAASLVSTTTSTLSSLITPQRVTELPLNGRNYTSLTLLQPGVTQSGGGSLTGFGSAGIEFSSMGLPISSNNYMLDGAILTNALDANGASGTGTTLGIDGIQEYRLITNGEDAEYGMKMASQTVIVSKSGTNQFHGDVFEFLRNSSLDARNDFDLPPTNPTLGKRLPEYRRSQFGGAAGGPIIKDKMFYFGVYEGLRSYLGTTNQDTTLAPGCQGGAGAVIMEASCPQLSLPVGGSATIAPQMARFVSLFPAPNLPNNVYGFVYPQNTVEDYAQLRLDYTLSSTDSVFGRWTFDNAHEPAGYNFGASYSLAYGRDDFITLAENHIFTPNLLSSARTSWSRAPVGVTIGVVNPLFNTPAYALIPNNAFGALTIGGVSTVGTNQNAPRISNGTILTGSDDVNYTRGRHSMKFGGIFNHYQNHTIYLGYNRGYGNFSGVDTFFTGLMSEYTGILPSSNYVRTYLNETMGFYGQDAWRLTPRLTINVGLRYEPITEYKDANGLGSSLRNPATDTQFTSGPEFLNPSLRNWGPRFGFAWDAFGDGKTAVHGGFGVQFDQTGYGNALEFGAGIAPPHIQQYTVTNTTLEIPYPAPAIGSFLPVGPTLDWHMAQPHSYTYNLTAERQLPYKMGLALSYAGSRGLHLIQTLEGNQVVPNGVPSANGGTECVAPPAGTTAPPESSTTNMQSQIDGSATSCYLSNAPRTNLNFGSIPDYTAGADSIYNSMQVRLNKNVTQGLQFQGTYTWGKVIDDIVSNGAYVGEPNNNKSRRGPAAFDVTDIFHFNALYHLPSFTESNGLVGKLSNGWWLSGIVSAQSGATLSSFVSGFRSQDGFINTYGLQTDQPDIVPGRFNSNITHGVSAGCGTGATRQAGGSAIAAGAKLHTKSLWYDPCAFSVEPAGFIGNVPRNFLRGPGYDDADISLVKDTAVGFLGDQGEVEFRSEFFNITNHPNFSLPTNTVSAGSCGGSVLGCTMNQANPGSSAGVITSTNGTSRQIQFALKVMF
jgi:hypothetical protein